MFLDLLTVGGLFAAALLIGLAIEKIRGPRAYTESDRLADKHAARRALRGPR